MGKQGGISKPLGKQHLHFHEFRCTLRQRGLDIKLGKLRNESWVMAQKNESIMNMKKTLSSNCSVLELKHDELCKCMNRIAFGVYNVFEVLAIEQ